MRLPNGYGSVTKLSGNRRRPYIVRITTGWDDEGKQLLKTLGYYPSKKEALQALVEYNASPYDPTARKFSLTEVYNIYCKQRYINNDIKIPNQYVAAYSYCTSIHQKAFADLKTADLQKVIDSCDKGYSTKKNIRVLMNLLYQYALANDIVIKNYANLTKLPPQVDSRIHIPFTEKELAILMEHSITKNVQTVLILCYTGMRPTEFLKIERDNVFLNERYMLGGIKTTAGRNRAIPISDKIYPFIESLYNENGKYLFEFDGKQLNYDKYRSKFWEPVMNQFKMNHLPHDGRHTCSTLMDNAGVNDTIKKKILGHAGKDVTQKVYTHKTIQQLLDAINLI